MDDPINNFIFALGTVELDSTFTFNRFAYLKKTHLGYTSVSAQETPIDTNAIGKYEDKIKKYLKTVRFTPMIINGKAIRQNWHFSFDQYLDELR